MNDSMRYLLTAFLIPVTWVLLGIYVIQPLSRLANRHLPSKLAAALTKERGAN